VPTRDFAIEQASNAFAGRKLLLDGQQRLTSLTAVINGDPVHVRGRKRPIEILFNLEHPDGPPNYDTEVTSDEDVPTASDDEQPDDFDDSNGDSDEQGILEKLNRRTFVVSNKNLASLPNWVSVSEIFKTTNDAEILEKAGIESFKDPRYQKYSDRLKKLRAVKDYSYVVHVLERSMSYEEVTEIFVRVNSLGAKLKSSDLALAQMSSRWPNLLTELEKFQEECESNGFPIDTLKEGWKHAQKGLGFAINFLRSNAGIEDESLLSSPMFIHVLAVVSHIKKNKLTLAEQNALLHWLLIGNARGRYSRGSTETLLNEDLAILFRTEEIPALIEPVKRQFGRLHIEAGDLVSRGVNSPLFSLTYLALKDSGAKDWYSGLGLSLTHQGKLHFIQWHHIIPKSLLKKKGYENGEINEIANMAFITGQTNRRISNKEATDYLLDIVNKQGEAALESQCVPVDPELWSTDNYRKFLKIRREALAKRMNEFIRSKANIASQP
jgi:hypothetical protein